jgi:hypothetical protein
MRRISDRVAEALEVRGELVREMQELLDLAESESRRWPPTSNGSSTRSKPK